MATPVEIAVKAVGTAQAGRAISGVDSKTSKLGGTLRKVAAVGVLALGAGAVKAAGALVDMTKNAVEDEAAQRRLAIGLKNATGATDKQVGSVEKWISAQGKLLGITDDEMRPALQRLAESSGSVTKAQKQLKIAFDVSAGTGKSLKTVTEAMMKANNGSVAGLSRLGLKTKDNKGETITYTAALRQMAQTFGGQAKAKAETLEGTMDRLRLIVDEAKESIGAKFIPVLDELGPYLIRTAEAVTNKVVPAVGDMVDWFKRNRGEIADTAGAVKDGLLPPLKTLGGVVAAAVKFFGGLPAPVQSFGAEAAAAAIILPRLTGAVGAAQIRMAGLVGSTATATTRIAALKGAARGAAGIGGMALLTAGAKTSNTALSTLANTGGAAMMGFAVGGPIGAAIGGSVGLLGSLWSKARAAHNAFDWYQDARVKVLDFKDALQQTNGAVSKQIRQMILLAAQEDGVAGLATRMNIAQRDLVGAVNGNEGATRRLNRAYAEHAQLLSGNEQADFNTWLRQNTDSFADEQTAIRNNAGELTSWRKLLKGLPPKVQTAVKAIGVDATESELARLKKRFDLNPKQVETVVKAIGTELAVKRVNGVWQVMEDGRRVKPNLDPWLQAFVGYMNRTDKTSHDFAFGKIPSTLRAGTSTARANLDPFTAGLSTSLNNAASRAHTQGANIGANIASGLAGGIGANAWQAVNAAGDMVAQAIAEANRRADNHSPSKVMHKAGRDMGEGLARGLDSKHARNKQAGKKAANSIIEGFNAGSGGVAKVVGRLSDLIATTFAHRARATRRRIDNAKAERQALHRLDVAEHARAKSLKRLDNALIANGKRQDQNNAKLEAARGKLKEILSTSHDYATSIRDAIVSTGDVTTLGKDEAGTATAGAILDQMRARLQAAQRFADLIAKLTKQGLNKTSLQQLLAAGVEGGLSTAEALAAGGPDTISQINKLTGQLTDAGEGLGTKAADTMYGAGIKAAEGLVAGLEAKEKAIDKVARRLANTLANAVRRALKVHSPSRVFEDIGRRTVDGLRVGLDETHVRTSGRRLAASLVDGFADPRLTATAVLDATTSGGAGTQTVAIRFTAEQLTALQRGQAVAADLDVAMAAGVRRRRP